jgi:hypothetical protein
MDIIGFAKPMIEPKNFENCISSWIEGDSLVINIKTDKSPLEYSLHTVYLFRKSDNKEQIIDNLSVSTLVEGNIFRIKINKLLIRHEEYSIRVLLDNEKRSRMEFYIS